MPEAEIPLIYIIIGLVVLVVVFYFVILLFFKVKIGQGVCNLVGFIIYSGLHYTGILSGITQAGITSGCGLLPF